MKKLRLFLLLLIPLIAGFLIYSYFASFQTLTVNLSSTMKNPRVTIYEVPEGKDVSNPSLLINDDSIVKKISRSETMKLQKGRYYVVAKSETTADSTRDITLSSKPETVDINPNLSKKILSEQVKAEEVAILPILYKTYPQINNDYVLQTGKLYEKGDWYSTTIVSGSNPEPRDYRDIFHIVLHKEDGIWKIKTRIPELNVDKYTYPDIPKEVLTEVNKQGISS